MNRTHERHITDVRDLFGEVKTPTKGEQRETDNKQNSVSSYTPRICTTNADVYFGNSPADVNGRALGSYRKKREAPRPPMLVDIDVSINEQNVSSFPDQPVSTRTVSATRQVVNGMSNGSQPTASLATLPVDCDNRPPGSTHDHRLNGSWVGEHSSSRGGANNDADLDKLNANDFMKSYNLPRSHTNPIFRDKGGSAKSDHSLDQSSSGVETDDNGTPEGTVQLGRHPTLTGATNTSKMVGQGRQRAPNPPDSSYNSEECSDQESDNFDEEEVTLDFDEEDDGPVEARRMQIYQEYTGDDFGQYLNDDHEEGIVAVKDTKKRPRRKKQVEKAPVSPTSLSSTSSGENTARKSLKMRLGGIFMASTAPNDKDVAYPSSRRISSIHNYTYADCKIGTQNGETADSTYATTSRSDPSSDISFGGDRKWWNTDTLSARTLDSNTDVMLKPRRRPSDVSDLMKSVSTPNFSRGPVAVGDPHTQDFESYRKNLIYDTKGAGKKSRKSSIFQRMIKKDVKGEVEGRDNTVINPLREGMLCDL